MPAPVAKNVDTPSKDEKTDKSGNVKVEKEEVVPATPSVVEIKSDAEPLPDLFKDMDEELPKTEVSEPIVAVKDTLDLEISEKKEKDVVP